ncbi:MAG: hypothetical protein IT282_12285 [Bacteroidetes bacterium]|nr:hypothetical protein [Bacteroidota bacterium]
MMMKPFTAQMKMAQVVHGNYLLLPVISRFGIPWGFGEKTVSMVCREHKVDVEFFLAMVNAFTNEHYVPEKPLQISNVPTIINYLLKTHAYYIGTQVPLIGKLLNDLLRRGPMDAGKRHLIRKFFLDYKRELSVHLAREETTTFPYMMQVYRLYHNRRPSSRDRHALSRYSMRTYAEEHTVVDEKLFDLKNILIKYVRSDSSHPVSQEVIFELFRLERDIQDHTRIEDHILRPLVERMENALFRPGETPVRPASLHVIPATEEQFSSTEHRSRPPSSAGSLTPRVRAGSGKSGLAGLTPRELEVLRLVACGYLNKQIADRLAISLHTVISHRKNITQKLQIKTVAGLTVYALLNHLISPKSVS